jgi:hypothetical protein
MEATWRMIYSKNLEEHGHKWVKRHFKELALFLCPPCSGGNWFTHQPDTWEILTPDWSMIQHDTEVNVWQSKKQALLDNEVTQMLCKGWADYHLSTHTLSPEEQNETQRRRNRDQTHQRRSEF